MSLNPKITKENGVYWLNWTPDPTAEGYAFATPGGVSRTFNPAQKRAKLGTNLAEPVVAIVTPLDVSARTPEQATYPPPITPPATKPLWDSRASQYTAIDYAQGVSVPAGLEFIINQPGDITLVPETRWPAWGGKAWRCHTTVNSYNPGWVGRPADVNGGEIVFEPKRPITDGQIDWYAQSIYFDKYVSFPDWWLIVTQYGYPRIWSAPGSLIFTGPGNWSNDTPVDQFGFIRASGTTPSEGSGTDQGQQGYTFRPMSTILGKRLDVVAGLQWRLTPTGFWQVASRLDNGPWETHLDERNIVTVEKVASEPLPWRPVVDKQGAYQRSSLSWPAGWEQTLLLRGLTRHATRADAEASLA